MECDYLNGWIKKWSHVQKISPKMVNTRDIAGERRRRILLYSVKLCQQSLEFIAEMNRKSWKKFYVVKKMDKHTPFYEKAMGLWMQIESTKLISIMNFSVLYFFKFAPTPWIFTNWPTNQPLSCQAVGKL